MKEFKVKFYGDKDKCLGITGTEEQRVASVNELLKKISSCDRSFFRRERDGNIAKFDIVQGVLIYFDDYTNLPIYNTYQSLNKWEGTFNGGGTLQNLINRLSIFITTGVPFFSWYLGASRWGYSDENVAAIKQFGIESDILIEYKRYMIWVHGESYLGLAESFISKNENKERFITVLTCENGKAPLWVDECNFEYVVCPRS
jgi:hypothetical protein